MNNYTEHTWTMVIINDATTQLMQTYLKYPPCKQQSASYSGPITLQQYERFQNMRETLEKQGFSLPMPTGN